MYTMNMSYFSLLRGVIFLLLRAGTSKTNGGTPQGCHLPMVTLCYVSWCYGVIGYPVLCILVLWCHWLPCAMYPGAIVTLCFVFWCYGHPVLLYCRSTSLIEKGTHKVHRQTKVLATYIRVEHVYSHLRC